MPIHPPEDSSLEPLSKRTKLAVKTGSLPGLPAIDDDSPSSSQHNLPQLIAAGPSLQPAMHGADSSPAWHQSHRRSVSVPQYLDEHAASQDLAARRAASVDVHRQPSNDASMLTDNEGGHSQQLSLHGSLGSDTLLQSRGSAGDATVAEVSGPSNSAPTPSIGPVGECEIKAVREEAGKKIVEIETDLKYIDDGYRWLACNMGSTASDFARSKAAHSIL